jgi:hypothetical protein
VEYSSHAAATDSQVAYMNCQAVNEGEEPVYMHERSFIKTTPLPPSLPHLSSGRVRKARRQNRRKFTQYLRSDFPDTAAAHFRQTEPGDLCRRPRDQNSGRNCSVSGTEGKVKVPITIEDDKRKKISTEKRVEKMRTWENSIGKMQEVSKSCLGKQQVENFYKQFEALVVINNEKLATPIKNIYVMAMGVPDYTHGYVMCDEAVKFYFKFIPELMHLADEAGMGEKLKEEIDSLLAQLEYQWYKQSFAAGVMMAIKANQKGRYVQ